MEENVVYVLSRDRKPLMPTKRFGHVRKLLKAKLAVPVSSQPFTIRLKYDTSYYTQEVHEGIDTGRENIGNGASLGNGDCVLLEDVRTNNKSVKSNMDDRRAFRRERRRHDRRSKQRKARHDDTEIQEGGDCIALIVKYLKGHSARRFFDLHPEIRDNSFWGGHLWSHSYYMGTLGNMSKSVVEKYISNQYSK